MSSATPRVARRLPERRDDRRLDAGPRQPARPLREYITDSGIAAANLGRARDPHGLHGHTHVPVAWSATPDGVAPGPGAGHASALDGASRTLLNPGSVGQPRDGDPSGASYLVLDPEPDA